MKYRWKFTYGNRCSPWSEETFVSKKRAFEDAIGNIDLEVISILVQEEERIK